MTPEGIAEGKNPGCYCMFRRRRGWYIVPRYDGASI
jgi:hypothetical protein